MTVVAPVTKTVSIAWWQALGLDDDLYRIGDRMRSVAVTAVGNELQLATPQQLFARAYAYGAGITIANFDVAKDGRFIMVRDDATVGRLRVIQNWHADTPAPR